MVLPLWRMVPDQQPLYREPPGGENTSSHGSPLSMNPARLDRAYRMARDSLLAERAPDGHWVGELSASALSTATAVSALALVQKHARSSGSHDALIAGGINWLAEHQNAD